MSDLAEDITHDAVCALVSYDPDTGILRWKTGRRGVKVGAIAGGESHSGYRTVGLFMTRVLAHRLAWFIHHGAWPAGQIDHISGDTSDNRICNLRVVTNAGNMQNQRRATAKNRTGLLGVYRRGDTFAMSITVGTRTVYRGGFRTPEAAHEAYVRQKRVLHEASTL